MDLDALRGRRGRSGAPQLVDQAVGRDDFVRLKEQHGQQRALLDSAERERAVLLAYLQGAKEPEVHTPF